MNVKQLVHRFINTKPRFRFFLTRLIEGRGETEVSLFGVTLRVDKLREHGYLRASRMAHLSSLWGDEAPVLVTLAAIIPAVDTFIDAGANVGLYSAVLGRLQLLQPKLRCYAFEADPTTFARLSANLVHSYQACHNVALSDKAGVLRFVRGAVSHVTTTIDNANAYSLSDYFDVPCRRLDSYDVVGDRLLIKIDVEGQELSVLRGASKWFDQGRCVAVYIDGFDRHDDVLAFLNKYNFTYYDGRSLGAATDKTFSFLALRNG